MILPTQIRELLSSNNISQILLKDGTILRINDSNIPQYYMESQEPQQSSMNAIDFEEREGAHNHHKGGIGYFGHHFKTQYYNTLCADCMIGGGVIKKRKNYVLYVSKNCTENDVALKHKLKNTKKQPSNQIIQKQIKDNIQEQIQEKINEQIEEQIKENIEEQIKENIEEQIKENIEEQILKEKIDEQILEETLKKEEEQIPVQIEENQIQKENEDKEKLNNKEKPEEIIMEGYVECNDVPILEEKIILRKDENNKEENLCNECKNENINNKETNENICNECKQEMNKENKEKENNIENINNEVNVEENNINNIQGNEEGEEINEMEKQEGEEEMNEIEYQEGEGEEEVNEIEQQQGEEEMNELEHQEGEGEGEEEMNEVEQQGEGMNEIEQHEEEINNIEQQNINEIGEDENLCDGCMGQQQNEGNEEQKITKTVQVLIPENQKEN